MKIDDAAARLEALGNPTRLKIYRALVRAGDNGLSVGRLQARLDVAASTLSHHLKSLMIVGLVTQERQATTLICRANYDVMNGLVARRQRRRRVREHASTIQLGGKAP